MHLLDNIFYSATIFRNYSLIQYEILSFCLKIGWFSRSILRSTLNFTSNWYFIYISTINWFYNQIYKRKKIHLHDTITFSFLLLELSDIQVVEKETYYIDLIRNEWIFRVSIHDILSKVTYNFRLMFQCSLKWKIGCQIFLWVWFFVIFQTVLEQYCQDETNNFLGQCIVYKAKRTG